MKAFETPILLLIFNRPEPTKQVFARIREARPVKLFIAADGPRPSKPGEAALCDEARTVASMVDWPCEVKTLFRSENLGCRKAVSEAITWFFGQVEEGIVLEDDCLPNLTFFPFAAQLLERYRTNERVGLIAGYNIAGNFPADGSYLFCKFGGIWGWASWRRAWRAYDDTLGFWKDPAAREQIRQSIGNRTQWKIKEWTYDRVLARTKDSWAYAWECCRLRKNYLAITPAVNLVENIGLGADATHTKARSDFALPAQAIEFPLVHPAQVAVDGRYDAYFVRTAFESTFLQKVVGKIKSIFS